MLEGVDAVDWGSLDCAYDRGAELPDLLRAVASGDPIRTENALPEWDLAVEWGLIHQAGVYPATAAVVPFLVELAAVPAVLVADQCLSRVAWAAVFEGASGDRSTGVRRAVAGQVAALVGLLDHENPLIRVNAATALGHADLVDATVADVLHDRWVTEPNPRVRPAMIASAAVCDPGRARDRLPVAFEDPHPGVRAAAVFASVLLGLPWTGATTRALHAALIGSDPLPVDPFWFWDTGEWFHTVIDHLDDDGRAEVLAGLLASSSASAQVEGARGIRHLRRRQGLE